ncbi:ribosomal-processing cysteine protease Prp [Streptococcus hyointestinalis]|uniref:ribosomal-processing cysteine protease Prp n=1 Tax=Streptococcus hyointestinalis TaxID=1337 RepID=UPI0013E055B7|nr:ribosomal-processing cysteine protease Prp [Streptococcus hyointestinalis]
MMQAIFTEEASDWSEMTITGQAGSGEHGFDVRCASVSMLAHNFANSVEAVTRKMPQVEMVDDGGYLVIQKPHNLTRADDTVRQTLFESVVRGPENHAENESNYVATPLIRHCSTKGKTQD